MIKYRIYKGDSAGGPVNYDSPVATVATPGYATPNLPAPSRTKYGVRAFDTATGMEERNRDVALEIVIDAAGRDVSRRPAAPVGVTIEPAPSGTVAARWRYLPRPGTPDPDQFNVYISIGGATEFGEPARIIPFVPGVLDYRVLADGMEPGATYSVVVTAAVTSGGESEAQAVVAVVKSGPPRNVSRLTGETTFSE